MTKTTSEQVPVSTLYYRATYRTAYDDTVAIVFSDSDIDSALEYARAQVDGTFRTELVDVREYDNQWDAMTDY